jgi:hypothetical protein
MSKLMQEIVYKGIATSVTPFVVFFCLEIEKLAREIGLKEIHTITTKD